MSRTARGHKPLQEYNNNNDRRREIKIDPARPTWFEKKRNMFRPDAGVRPSPSQTGCAGAQANKARLRRFQPEQRNRYLGFVGMPLYYFTIEDGERISDDHGYEFPDDDTARLQAERISHDLSKSRSGGRNWVITVTDAFGRKIAEVPTTWEDIE